MLKPVSTLIVCTILALCFSQVYGQQKYERERRLPTKDVPAKAMEFLDSLEIEEKIKWYLEEGLDRKSIEAKYKLDKQRYSIEFDTTGNLEDIEVEVLWSQLPKQLSDSISAELGKDCERYKLQKVQIQYSGNRSALLANMKTGENTGNYVIKYELIVRCRSAKNVALYEYLFSEKGQILTTSQIIFKNSSNLEY